MERGFWVAWRFLFSVKFHFVSVSKNYFLWFIFVEKNLFYLEMRKPYGGKDLQVTFFGLTPMALVLPSKENLFWYCESLRGLNLRSLCFADAIRWSYWIVRASIATTRNSEKDNEKYQSSNHTIMHEQHTEQALETIHFWVKMPLSFEHKIYNEESRSAYRSSIRFFISSTSRCLLTLYSHQPIQVCHRDWAALIRQQLVIVIDY